MSMYRENGAGGLRSDRQGFSWSGLLLGLFLTGCVIGLYALAAEADRQEEIKARKLAAAEKLQLAMPTRVREAYERGMSDALEALKDTDDGLQLTQACMSKGMRWVEGGVQP